MFLFARHFAEAKSVADAVERRDTPKASPSTDIAPNPLPRQIIFIRAVTEKEPNATIAWRASSTCVLSVTFFGKMGRIMIISTIPITIPMRWSIGLSSMYF